MSARPLPAFLPMETAPLDGTPVYLRLRDEFGPYATTKPRRFVGGRWVNAAGVGLSACDVPMGWRPVEEGAR